MRRILLLTGALLAFSSNGAHAGAPSISAGAAHSLAVKADGSLVAWGRDTNGELGVGRRFFSTTPVLLDEPTGVIAVAAGGHHMLALRSDGTVWGWGRNDHGQLGVTGSEDVLAPARIEGLTDVIAIAAGTSHSMALRRDRTVWTWGRNSNGELGDGTTNANPTPRQVAGIGSIVAIAAGEWHTVALEVDGTAWAWGYNYWGQLGNDSRVSAALPAKVAGLPPAKAISAGHAHTVALLPDGTVWGWGNNDSDQIEKGGTAKLTPGPPARNPVPAPIAGLGDAIAVSARGNAVAVLKNDATVWIKGYHRSETGDISVALERLTSLTGATAISLGGQYVEFMFFSMDPFANNFSFVLASRADGTVLARGDNQAGQLGDGTRTRRGTAVPVTGLAQVRQVATGIDSAVAVRTDGRVLVWGSNAYGQLGDGIQSRRSVPVGVSLPAAVASISGGLHSVAALVDGSVWAWGPNTSGQLGDGTFENRSSPVRVAGISGVTSVSASAHLFRPESHTLALKQDGTVWAWGNNIYGQLGNNSNSITTAPVQVAGLSNVTAVAAGAEFSLALKNDGTVWAWGDNFNGQLGDGTRTSRWTPVQVNGLTGVVAIAAGDAHSLALKANGTVWVWGDGGRDANFDLVLRPPTQIVLPVAAKAVAAGSTFVALGVDGTVWDLKVGSLDGTLGPPVAIAGLQGIEAVDSTYGTILAMRGDATLVALGSNYYGQLGDGTFAHRTQPQLVLREGGAGNLDSNDWFLDLDPSRVKNIPSTLVPRIVVLAFNAASLSAAINYRLADYGKTVGNYVLGRVPASFLKKVPLAPWMTKAAVDELVKADELLFVQLTSQGWATVSGQLLALNTGVINANGSASNILRRIDLGAFGDARFCIGYGENAAAMFTGQTIAEVLSLSGAPGSASGLPCVQSGVYVSGPAASSSGTPVTFTATVIGIEPTGTVQLKDQSLSSPAPIGPALTLASQGAAVANASFAVAGLAVGTHSIGARYSGDGNNPASNVAVPLLHTVAASASTVSLVGPVSSTRGDPVVLAAVVSGRTPTGHVQFSDGGVDLGSAVPLVEGRASITAVSLAVGDHALSAHYLGDGQNAAGSSAALAHKVHETLVTRVELTSSANPAAAGAAVTFVAVVRGSAPNGNVLLRNAERVLGTVALANGEARFLISGLDPGLHAVVAHYQGDLQNPAASSEALFQVVHPAVLAASTTTLAASANPTSLAQVVTFTATVAGGAGVPGGKVAFTTGAGIIGGCASVPLSAGSAACSTNALPTGTHQVTATYSGGAGYEGSVSAALPHTVNAATSLLSAQPSTLGFGGQSMRTTSEAKSATITNATGAQVTITSVFAPAGFSVASNNCATLAAGASCTVSLRFTPMAEGPAAGLLALGYTGGGPTVVMLTGVGEKSLATHYYRSILRRDADQAGKDFWLGEAARVQALGANASEVWYAMAMSFFFSPEYAILARDNPGFVTDLYNTFFNRPPDQAGFDFWTAQIAGGMPREGVLVNFMFSPEFANFTSGIFGAPAARAEVNVVMDFYRGLLSRLPDTAGLSFYVGQFRAAQCQGQAAVLTQVENISSGYLNSPEYSNRGRTNSQFMADVYNAFMRRGPDLAGLNFYVNQLNTGGKTREQIRQEFKTSPEFNNRVTAILGETCVP